MDKKIILLVIVLAMAAGACFYFALYQQPAAKKSVSSATPNKKVVITIPPANPKDISDTAIGTDLYSIDMQMNRLSVDSASINYSLSNQ